MFGCGPQDTSFSGAQWMEGLTMDEIYAEVSKRNGERRIKAELHSYRVLMKAIEEHKAKSA